MSAPQVSVIIPSYDRVDLLQATLDSVRGQTFTDFELIVVDDGSSDGTLEMLSGYDDLTFLRTPHRGPAAARNAGLALARADVVAFLDSDDLWEPPFLEQMMAAKGRRHRWVYCDYGTFAAGAERASCLRDTQKDPSDLVGKLLTQRFIAMGAFIADRQLLRQLGGFNPGLRVGEDWDMILRLADAAVPGFVDSVLVRLRMYQRDQWRGREIQKLGALRVLATFQRDQRSRVHEPLIRRHRVRLHKDLMLHFIRGKDWGPALEHLGRMVTAGMLRIPGRR